MAKQIVIRKHRDKIVLSVDGEKVADIVVAKSSRTESVNLSIQANLDVKIEKQSQRSHEINTNKKPRGPKKYTEEEQWERRKEDRAAITKIDLA